MSANIDVFAPQKLHSDLRRTPLSELSALHQRVTELEQEVKELKNKINQYKTPKSTIPYRHLKEYD